jgi:hypothetical protein
LNRLNRKEQKKLGYLPNLNSIFKQQKKLIK